MASKTNVILEKPSDWDEWITVIKNRARDADVGPAIDYEQKEEPPQPVEPVRPSPSQFEQGATSLSSLSADKKEDLKLAYEIWKQDMISYRSKKQALQDIRNFILTTIARQHIQYADKNTVYQILVALKARIAPTDRARKYELSKQYKELLSGPKNQHIK